MKNFILKFSKQKAKYDKLKADDRATSSINFGVSSILNSIFSLVCIIISAFGYRIFNNNDGLITIIGIILMILFIICSIILLIWSIINLVFQAKLNNKSIKLIAVITLIICITGGLTAFFHII